MRRSTKLVLAVGIGVFVLSIAGISIAVFYFVKAEQTAQIAREGYLAAFRGNYDEAIEKFDAAFQRKSGRNKLAWLYLNRAGAYSAKWRFDDALRDYAEALRLDPQSTGAYAGRGYVYLRKGEQAKATADFTEVIRRDPNSAMAYYNRGLILSQSGENDRALADLDEAVRCDPASAAPLVMRGSCRIAKNDLDRALADFDGAIAVEPMNAMGYMQRANLYFRKGDQQKGERDREHARLLDPNIEAASNNLAAFLIQKQWASTVSPAWAQHVGEGYFEVFRKARQAADVGDLDQAIQLYNVVLAMDITSVQASPVLMNRANAYQAKGDLERALLDYDQAIRLDPNNAGAYVNHALALTEKGRREEAMKDYATAIRIKPDQWEAYFNRAAQFSEQGDSKHAIEDLTTVIRLNPNYANGYVNRAAVYRRAREWTKASNDCEMAIKIDPGVAEAYLNRAAVHEHFRDRKKELADLQMATSLNPRKFHAALNGLAWRRATSSDKEVRNGKDAVEAAIKACEVTTWQNEEYVDTLAAAYAEVGDFERAVDFQEWVLQMPKVSAEDRPGMEQRLKLYRRYKPYREEPRP